MNSKFYSIVATITMCSFHSVSCMWWVGIIIMVGRQNVHFYEKEAKPCVSAHSLILGVGSGRAPN